jgi:metal-sulfur cluster biosynthetic enzyme
MTEAVTINEEEVVEALKAVADPEIGVDVVNLGLVYGVEIEGSKVKVHMTLTSLGCPATGLMEFTTKEAVGTVPGVEDVEVEWTFDPPWTPERMTDEGREMLQAMGYW